MKRDCSHRWRDIWAGHAGLRRSAIAHAYSKRPAKGNRFGDIRGATAVEFGFIASPLILMLLGTVDGGRMLWTQNALQYAVEQAARYAALNQGACTQQGSTTTCYTTAQIQSYAASMAYATNISASQFASANPGCGATTIANTMLVTASVPYTPLFPYPHSITLTASSCRPW